MPIFLTIVWWKLYYIIYLELNHNKVLWKVLWLICVRKGYLESFSLCHNAGFLSRLISSKTAWTKSTMVEQRSAREEEQRRLQSYCQSRPWADEQKTGERPGKESKQQLRDVTCNADICKISFWFRRQVLIPQVRIAIVNNDNDIALSLSWVLILKAMI